MSKIINWFKQKFAWLRSVKPNNDDFAHNPSSVGSDQKEVNTTEKFTTVNSKEDFLSLSRVYFNQPTEIIDEYETVAFDALGEQGSNTANTNDLKLRSFWDNHHRTLVDPKNQANSSSSEVMTDSISTEIPDVYDDLNQKTGLAKSELAKIDQKIQEFYPKKETSLTAELEDQFFVHDSVKIPLGDGKELQQNFETQKLESISTQKVHLDLNPSDSTTETTPIIKTAQ